MMPSEKEIEAAREVLEQHVYDEGGCEVERVPAMVREMLEAAARARAEGNSVAGSEGTENSFILRAVGDIEDLADDLKGDRGVILEGSAEAIREAGKLWGERVRIIAASAHPAPQPSGTVGVKPLKWDEHPAGGQQAIAAGLGLYRVHANGDDWYLVPDHMGKGGRAAAQADYERRILSALTAGKPEQAVPSGWKRNRYECPTCGGSGEIAPDAECPDCDGTGACVPAAPTAGGGE